MRTENDAAKQVERNAFDIPTFCDRNAISSSTAYKLARDGKLRISKLFGKALVTVEDEADFRKLLRAGKLASVAERGNGRGKRAKPAEAAA